MKNEFPFRDKKWITYKEAKKIILPQDNIIMANSGAATLEQAQNTLNQLIDSNEVQYNRGLIFNLCC